MKLTRNELKSVVKECLIEILSEGIGSTVARDTNESVKKQIFKSNTQHVPSATRQSDARVRAQSQALKEAIKLESGGNDIMAAILTDTAEKSLQTMMASDRPGIAKLPTIGTAENIVASLNPEDLFGEESASKWASLAFNAPKK